MVIGLLQIVQSYSEPIGPNSVTHQAISVLKFCLQWSSVQCLIGVEKIANAAKSENNNPANLYWIKHFLGN